MLLFKKKYLDLIRSGRKTQTVRLWPHRRMRTGQKSYVPGVGHVAITSVEEVELDELRDADAVADGFASLAELREDLDAIYSQGAGQPRLCFRVRFRLLTTNEAAAFEKSTRRKKKTE